MATMKLLITDKIDETKLEPIKKYFEIDRRVGISPKELSKIILNYHAVITRTSTSLPRELIEKATNLKIIARAGIGVDNIDIFAATERGIAVINAPKGNARVTAEHTIGLVFALLRHIPQAAADLKSGFWNKQKYVGSQIAGKKLGIVGFGNVGKEVFRIASGVGMEVVVCEPYVRLPEKVKKVTFDELLTTCDVITFHVPSTYLTRRMLNRKTISLCKKGVYIINCSRGAVVDEGAILDALKTGKIAGFAVDVFTKEPAVSKELLELPNVIATPHIAGSTHESQAASVGEVVSGIGDYLEGKLPSNLLNPQVFKKSTRLGKTSRLDFDVVIFDSDSTLSAIEGVDELADFVGKKSQVAQLTQEAMEGKSDFEKVYEERLDLIKPSKAQLLDIGNLYIKHLMEDAHEVIQALSLLGKEVYIVSGGFTQALLELSKFLNLPTENVFGNDLLFDKKGNYQSFIEGPLRRNHGKLQIIRQIPGKKLMVGDSITDLETREGVDLFVGYGGVVKREAVESDSDLFLYCQSLAPILVIAAGVEGCIKLLDTKYKKLVGKGVDLLSHPEKVKKNRSWNLRFAQFKQLAYY